MVPSPEDENYPSSTTPIKTIGLREVCEVNSRTFSRRKGTQEWTERSSSLDGLEPPPASPSSPPPNYLSLIHHNQSPGEPLHWSLFIAPENSPGYIYEVKGDAQYMSYQCSDTPIDIIQSDGFANIYTLAVLTDKQDMVVRQVAEKEPPPRAADRLSVTENCQGWCVRVIARLVEMGIVKASKLEMVRGMVQPI